MILKGVKAVQRFKKDKKQENLMLWYERNAWAGKRRHRLSYRYGEERGFDDHDYPGPGLEEAFFDIPNM